MTNWSNTTKHTTSFTNQGKNIASYNNQGVSLTNSFLLLENGSYILQESGFKIILDQNVAVGTPYNYQTKN